MQKGTYWMPVLNTTQKVLPWTISCPNKHSSEKVLNGYSLTYFFQIVLYAVALYDLTLAGTILHVAYAERSNTIIKIRNHLLKKYFLSTDNCQ